MRIILVAVLLLSFMLAPMDRACARSGSNAEVVSDGLMVGAVLVAGCVLGAMIVGASHKAEEGKAPRTAELVSERRTAVRPYVAIGFLGDRQTAIPLTGITIQY